MKKTGTRVLLAMAVLFLLIQAIQPDRSNPPVTGDDIRQHVPVTPRVSQILNTACFDCHSNETRWPWYSYVAPVSWLVSRDVSGGRRHVNFSEWATYDRRQQIARLGGMADEVKEGAMPLPIYVAMHAEADLSSADRDSLVAWAETLRSALIDQDRAERDGSSSTDNPE